MTGGLAMALAFRSTQHATQRCLLYFHWMGESSPDPTPPLLGPCEGMDRWDWEDLSPSHLVLPGKQSSLEQPGYWSASQQTLTEPDLWRVTLSAGEAMSRTK